MADWPRTASSWLDGCGPRNHFFRRESWGDELGALRLVAQTVTVGHQAAEMVSSLLGRFFFSAFPDTVSSLGLQGLLSLLRKLKKSEGEVCCRTTQLLCLHLECWD